MTSGPIPLTGVVVVRSRLRRRRVRAARSALLVIVLAALAGALGSALRPDGNTGARGATGIPNVIGIGGGSHVRGAPGVAAAPGSSDGPFAREYAGRTLRPDLAAALRSATKVAARQGISLVRTSGFRSWQAQQRLFDQAVRRYGGASEAARWVLPPERSLHVQGRAVDVGDEAAAHWLEANGSAWGCAAATRTSGGTSNSSPLLGVRVQHWPPQPAADLP